MQPLDHSCDWHKGFSRLNRNFQTGIKMNQRIIKSGEIEKAQERLIEVLQDVCCGIRDEFIKKRQYRR